MLIDTTLKTLSKFRYNEFIEKDVKFKFTENLYRFYGLITIPINKDLLDSYTIVQNNLNPNTGITSKHLIKYFLDDFIQEYINDLFVEFYNNFYGITITSGDESGNKNYFESLKSQLLYIINEIKVSNDLSGKRKNKILDAFQKGYKNFLKRFGEKRKRPYRGRIGLEDSFMFKHYARRYGELVIFRDRLIDNNLIDGKTGVSQFTTLFSGRKVHYKVNWRGKKNQFYYFIKVLNHHPDFNNLGDNKWEVAMRCFDFIDTKTGKQFNWKKLKGTHDPVERNAKIINNCFKVF